MGVRHRSKSFARRLAVEENGDYEERRLLVLREAARLFVEKGVLQTSMEEIAERLNVTKPTVYHYLGSKDGVIVEIIRRGARMLDDFLESLEVERLSGLERLRRLLRAYATSIGDDFARCLIAIDVKALQLDSRREYGRARARLIELVQGMIEEGIRDGSIRKQDPRLATYAILGAFNFIALWYRPGTRLAPDAIAGAYLDLFERGLLPEAPRRSGKERRHRRPA